MCTQYTSNSTTRDTEIQDIGPYYAQFMKLIIIIIIFIQHHFQSFRDTGERESQKGEIKVVIESKCL